MHFECNKPWMQQMTIVDDVLWAIKDGKWHNVDEIKEKMSLSKTKIEIILKFLSEYAFVQISKTHTKVRVRKSTKNFINDLSKLELETN